jgi:uncharacterized protein DUF2325
MRIAVIGGRYKNEEQLSRIAKASGYDLEYWEGHVNGRGVEGIRSAVARAGLVVIVTDVNSHGAVFVAKKAARQAEKPILIVQKFGAVRLKVLLDALDRRRSLDEVGTEIAAS